MQQHRPAFNSAAEPATSTAEADTSNSALADVAARYAVAITPAVSDLIASSPDAEQIARQFLPDTRELQTLSDEAPDPIGDHPHEVCPGLIHRYPDRVLLQPVKVCAVYCRFCFRRETVGPDQGAPLSSDQLTKAIDYISAHPQIWEVIVSGGDPLIMSPRRVRTLTERLDAIEHVKIIRWHSRIPALDPDRITLDLIAALRATTNAVYVAVHVNHPSELTPSARAACARLVDAGVVLVSQSVLLAGVNDNVETLDALMRAFVETRIKPHYLHHLDRAPGTAHFRTSIASGRSILKSLRGRLSGLAQPTYILDIPGGYGKVPIGPDFLHADQHCEGECYSVEDPAGCRHMYYDDPRAKPIEPSAKIQPLGDGTASEKT